MMGDISQTIDFTFALVMRNVEFSKAPRHVKQC